MKPFVQIAIPHQDIIEGRLTMDVFAADLWQVVNGSAPLDYSDKDIFFKKTFITDGLKNILNIAKRRLEGKTGDSVIQIQTPFGGGKTHTLIALYHKAKEWKVNVVVIEGTALNPKDRKLWEELERQLTGKIELTKGDIAPGKDKLLKILSEKSPTLILMDEILEYITKAGGVKVGNSDLAAQSFAFIQELTGVVSAIGNSLLVLSLPSSSLEHYDENTERIFHKLQKITGRIEKIYAPIKDDEIEYVVRARLFDKVDEREAKKVVENFVNYLKNEGLLKGDEVSEYRNKFLKSYPFKPEVIDILYKRWGSYPDFQRTRGVLRLLSLVVYNLLDKNLPFIRLGDFDLSKDEIKREIIKIIGSEWDSIISQDITSKDSGANKVDESVATSYKGYKLGSIVSTTIFMMSFSGKGQRKGASEKEIKISSSLPEFPSSQIDTVISNLRERLFFLSDSGLFFTNQPNLNRIITIREENITHNQIYEKEKEILEKYLKGSTSFKVYIHPKNPKDIPDTPDLKLLILNKEKPDREFLENYGESPRVYRNTLIFLCIDENQKEPFYNYLKKLIVLKDIEKDTSLNLTDGQKKELKEKIKSCEQREYEELRKYYRKLFLPDKKDFKEIDMGLPTFGAHLQIEKEVYDFLRTKGEILEGITPKLIKEKFLFNKDYVEIVKLYESFLRTPGELRLVSKNAFENSIKEGVKEGLFGFGDIVDGNVVCRCFKGDVNVSFIENEIIIEPTLCKETEKGYEGKVIEILPPEGKSTYEGMGKLEEVGIKGKIYKELNLKLNVPVGQISTVANIINYLKQKFSKCNIEITISTGDGEIATSDYEDKIYEAINQAGITLIEEKNS